MYLALIVVSLLILFNTVNILESANNKMQKKIITGFAMENNDSTNSSNLTDDISITEKLYSSKSYIIFYMFIVGIIIAILISFLVLKSTINRNIEFEENERRL